MSDKHDDARGRPGGLLRAALWDADRGEGLLKAVSTVESALDSPSAKPTLVSGLHGGAPALLLAAWHDRSGRPGLVVTPDRETADQLAADLEIWLGEGLVIHLPQQEVLAFDHNSPEPALVGDFLTGLARLRDGVPRLMVTSVYGLRQRVMAPATLGRAILELKVGRRLDMDELGLMLAQRGYRPAGMVAKVGWISSPRTTSPCGSSSSTTRSSRCGVSTSRPSAPPNGAKRR